MEWIESLLSQIEMYISVSYLLIFMFLSYFVKRYFGDLLQMITKFEWKTVYSVLILATLVGILFLIFTDEGLIRIVITYCVGTSVHELFFKLIEEKITK